MYFFKNPSCVPCLTLNPNQVQPINPSCRRFKTHQTQAWDHVDAISGMKFMQEDAVLFFKYQDANLFHKSESNSPDILECNVVSFRFDIQPDLNRTGELYRRKQYRKILNLLKESDVKLLNLDEQCILLHCKFELLKSKVQFVEEDTDSFFELCETVLNSIKSSRSTKISGPMWLISSSVYWMKAEILKQAESESDDIINVCRLFFVTISDHDLREIVGPEFLGNFMLAVEKVTIIICRELKSELSQMSAPSEERLNVLLNDCIEYSSFGLCIFCQHSFQVELRQIRGYAFYRRGLFAAAQVDLQLHVCLSGSCDEDTAEQFLKITEKKEMFDGSKIVEGHIDDSVTFVEQLFQNTLRQKFGRFFVNHESESYPWRLDLEKLEFEYYFACNSAQRRNMELKDFNPRVLESFFERSLRLLDDKRQMWCDVRVNALRLCSNQSARRTILHCKARGLYLCAKSISQTITSW
jgi:hypothetical protein